jgi:hypothetical protein
MWPAKCGADPEGRQKCGEYFKVNISIRAPEALEGNASAISSEFLSHDCFIEAVTQNDGGSRVGNFRRPRVVYEEAVWTSAMVAKRLLAAFAQKHLETDAPKLCSQQFESAPEDDAHDDETTKVDLAWCAGSDYRQLCCGESRFDTDWLHDREWTRQAYRDGTKLLVDTEPKAMAAPRVRPERDDAKRLRETQRTVRADPSEFRQLFDTYVALDRPVVINDEFQAVEAQGRITAPLHCPDLEISRHLVLAWLRSLLDRAAFCRKHDLPVAAFSERFDDVCAAIAADLNNRSVGQRKVKHVRLFGSQVIRGHEAIASYLGRSSEGTQSLIDDGKLPVAEHDGVIIANSNFVRHMRKHRTRSCGAISQITRLRTY